MGSLLFGSRRAAKESGKNTTMRSTSGTQGIKRLIRPTFILMITIIRIVFITLIIIILTAVNKLLSKLNNQSRVIRTFRNADGVLCNLCSAVAEMSE